MAKPLYVAGAYYRLLPGTSGQYIGPHLPGVKSLHGSGDETVYSRRQLSKLSAQVETLGAMHRHEGKRGAYYLYGSGKREVRSSLPLLKALREMKRRGIDAVRLSATMDKGTGNERKWYSATLSVDRWIASLSLSRDMRVALDKEIPSGRGSPPTPWTKVYQVSITSAAGFGKL